MYLFCPPQSIWENRCIPLNIHGLTASSINNSSHIVPPPHLGASRSVEGTGQKPPVLPAPRGGQMGRHMPCVGHPGKIMTYTLLEFSTTGLYCSHKSPGGSHQQGGVAFPGERPRGALGGGSVTLGSSAVAERVHAGSVGSFSAPYRPALSPLTERSEAQTPLSPTVNCGRRRKVGKC